MFLPDQTIKNIGLVSAPGTAVVKGKTFLIDKVNTAQVFTIFERAIQEVKKKYNPFKEVVDALEGLSISDEQKSSLLMQAHRVKVSGELPVDKISDELRTCEGVAFYLWVLTRKNHPEVSLEEIKSMITEDNRLDVYVDIDEACGANMINKAVIDNGFFPQASAPKNPG